METILGTIGSILSIIANLPQLYRVRYPNTTKDLDWRTTFISTCSGGIWSGYGYLNKLWLLCAESAFVGLLHFLILIAIIRDFHIKRAENGTNKDGGR